MRGPGRSEVAIPYRDARESISNIDRESDTSGLASNIIRSLSYSDSCTSNSWTHRATRLERRLHRHSTLIRWVTAQSLLPLLLHVFTFLSRRAGLKNSDRHVDCRSLECYQGPG
jgi:hypothetical protein